MTENNTYELKLISDSQGFLIGDKNNNVNNELNNEKEQIKKLNTIDENVKQIRKILDEINPFSKTDIKQIVNNAKLQNKVLKKQILNLNNFNTSQIVTPKNRNSNNQNKTQNFNNSLNKFGGVNNFLQNKNNNSNNNSNNSSNNSSNNYGKSYTNNNNVNNRRIFDNTQLSNQLTTISTNAVTNNTNNINNLSDNNNLSNNNVINTPQNRQRDARGRFVSNNTNNNKTTAQNANISENKNLNGRDAKGRFLAKNKDGSDDANNAKRTGLLSKIADSVKNGFGELNTDKADEIDPAIKAVKEVSAPFKFAGKLFGGTAKLLGGGIKNLFSRGKNVGTKTNPSITQTEKSELNEAKNNEKKRLNIFRKIGDGLNKARENTKKFYKSLLKRLGNIEEDTERIGKQKKSSWIWTLLKFLPGLLISALTGIFTKFLPFLVSKVGGSIGKLILRSLLGTLFGAIFKGLGSLIGGIFLGSLKKLGSGIKKIFGFGNRPNDINSPNASNTANNRNNRNAPNGTATNRGGVNIPDVNTPNNSNGRTPNQNPTRATSRIGRIANYLKQVKIPVIGTALALLATGLAMADTEGTDLSRREKDKMHGENIGGFLGGGLGGWGGATAGAAMGTLILPGIGTAIGAILGGIAGFFGGNSIGEWFGGFAGEWFNDLRQADIAGFIKAKWDAFCEFCKIGWTSAVEFFQNSWQSISEFFQTNFAGFTEKLDAVVKWFNENFGGLFSKISGVFDAVISWLKKLPGVGKAVEIYQQVKKEYIEPAKNSVKNLWENYVAEPVKNATNSTLEFFGWKDKKTTPTPKQSATPTTAQNSAVQVDATTEASQTFKNVDTSNVGGDLVSFYTKKENSINHKAFRKNGKVFGLTPDGSFTSEEAAYIHSLRKNKVNTSASMRNGISQEVQEIIVGAAKRQNVPPEYLLAMAAMESGGNVNAVSSTGASGLFQFTGKTASSMGITNRFDPRQNAEGGAKYMAENANALKRAGLPVTMENLYLLHQKGGPGGIMLLKLVRDGKNFGDLQNLARNGSKTAASLISYISKNVGAKSGSLKGVVEANNAALHSRMKKAKINYSLFAKNNNVPTKAEPKVAANSVQNVSVMQKSNEPNLAVISKNKPPTAPSVANVKSIKSPENIPNAKPTSEQKIVASQNFISPDNVGQNLSDPRMAHIATGGIGGSFVA